MKKNHVLTKVLAVCTVVTLHIACSTEKFATEEDLNDISEKANYPEYTGTAKVTKGFATATTDNLYIPGIRETRLGVINSSKNRVWTVPADVNYTNDAFPFAPDLHNADATQYENAADALADFDKSNIIEIDPDGQLITGYIFGDNYFELYVNGVPIGKDAIPFTVFNSHIVQFRVSKPYTIAMLLVDWEENLGVGTEYQSKIDSPHYCGDGGMVAIFKTKKGSVVAKTGSDWKAQTFYTAPIKDLTCVQESGTTRMSANCNTEPSYELSDGESFYGLHWEVPSGWMNLEFDDSDWPNATTYTNETISVENKPSYMNFTDIFDDPSNDAQFIWSTNVILDNEVIVRHTVQ